MWEEDLYDEHGSFAEPYRDHASGNGWAWFVLAAVLAAVMFAARYGPPVLHLPK